MKLCCLGTTGYHPSQTRHTACYYLPEPGIVLDAGSGAFRLTEMLMHQPKQSLDLFLSHSHLDHVFGLTFILDTMAVTTLKKLRVYGDPEKLDAVREHLFAESIFPVLPPIDFMPLSPDRGTMKLDDEVLVDWFPLEHPGGCLGFRFTFKNGKTLAYVTDTVARPDADYTQYIRGVDLLLHECYFSDEQQEFAVKTGHSWVSGVCDLVREHRPKRTALIHVNPIGDLVNKPVAVAPHNEHLNIRVPNDEEWLEF